MSVQSNVSFNLSLSKTGYTLTVGFPSLGIQKEIPFTVGQSPEKGATLDLHSQNGKAGGDHPLSFFSSRDVKDLKGAVKLLLPEFKCKAQTLFVLDLRDANGSYEDLESIRQS